MTAAPKEDLNDIQGLLRTGYGSLPAAVFLLLRVTGRSAAAVWLARLHPTSAAEKDVCEALQIAFTAPGLRALGVPAEVCRQFSAEFVSGMSGDASRSRRLGDTGVNSPEKWEWGGSEESLPHVMLMLYTKEGALASAQSRLESEVTAHGFSIAGFMGSASLDSREPFGFVDGISQPELDWKFRGRAKRESAAYPVDSAWGEFILGYPNEYGEYTGRPLVTEPAANLPDTLEPAHAGKKDLGRNGSYLVLRRLAQDVPGFWQYLKAQAGGKAAHPEELAELMVGRRIDARATPLVAGADPSFTYESDPDGMRCPFGAHIRRVNPRNGDMPYGTSGPWLKFLRFFGCGHKGIRGDLIASTRFHRILRRGRDYGPQITPEEAMLSTASTEERGINFICLNANISRQFEFVQNAWAMSPKFDGLNGETDPLAGHRSSGSGCPLSGNFTYHDGSNVRQSLQGLPHFVTVRAGAYFFLPGIRALHYLARLGGSAPQV